VTDILGDIDYASASPSAITPDGEIVYIADDLVRSPKSSSHGPQRVDAGPGYAFAGLVGCRKHF